MRYILALMLCYFAGCGSLIVIPATPCSVTGLDKTGWKSVQEDNFSFQIPADFNKSPVGGFDSLAGGWESPGKQAVFYDYGRYSSTLDEFKSSLKAYAECSFSNDSRSAKVVSGQNAEGQTVVAATWRDVKPGLHLTLTTNSPHALDIALLYTILRSVRFSSGSRI